MSWKIIKKSSFQTLPLRRLQVSWLLHVACIRIVRQQLLIRGGLQRDENRERLDRTAPPTHLQVRVSSSIKLSICIIFILLQIKRCSWEWQQFELEFPSIPFLQDFQTISGRGKTVTGKSVLEKLPVNYCSFIKIGYQRC